MAKVESKAELDTLKVVIQDKYSSETVSVSPLSLYSSYEKIDIELRVAPLYAGLSLAWTSRGEHSFW